MGYVFSALIGSAVIFMAIVTEIKYQMYQTTQKLAEQGQIQQAEFVQYLNKAVVRWLQDNAGSCSSGSCVIQDVCSYLQSQTDGNGHPYYTGPCESPLGESGWKLTYNAQGNYILQATQFNSKLFQRYIPVDDPSYNIASGVTIADKVLADTLVKYTPQLVQSSLAVGVVDLDNNGAVNVTPGMVFYTDATSFMQRIVSQLGL
jgi:hypothetical protein